MVKALGLNLVLQDFLKNQLFTCLQNGNAFKVRDPDTCTKGRNGDNELKINQGARVDFQQNQAGDKNDKGLYK